MTEFKQVLGRIIAGAYYDFQGIRQSLMNKIRDIIRRKDKGIAFDEVEKKKKEKKYEKDYADNFLRAKIEQMKKKGKLTAEEEEYVSKFLNSVLNIKKQEEEYKKMLASYVSSEQIWTDFLQHIRGIDMVLTANLLRLIGYCEGKKKDGSDICPHISSLWKYSGLTPSQKRVRGQKIDWNVDAKVLAWKIGDSFIKQNTPFYRDIYDKEKKKQLKILKGERSDKGKETTKIHAHRRAMRKMVKRFLAHYWWMARKLKGMPLSEPYVANLEGHHIKEMDEEIKEVIEKNKVMKKTKKVKAN